MIGTDLLRFRMDEERVTSSENLKTATDTNTSKSQKGSMALQYRKTANSSCLL